MPRAAKPRPPKAPRQPKERSLLKWVGGKSRLAPMLVDRILANGGPAGYIEPFCGSAAVFFELRRRGLPGSSCVLNDAAPGLAACLQAVRDEPEKVIDKHEQLRTLYQRAWDRSPEAASCWFVQLRNRVLDPKLSPATAAAVFLAVNRLGFNGIFRLNAKGACNTPWGKQKPRAMVPPAVIRAAGDLLAGAVVSAGDVMAELRRSGGWGDAAAGSLRGQTIYLDPPYRGTFDRHVAGGFSDAQHVELAGAAAACANAGAHVLATLDGTDETRALWSARGFRLEDLLESRSVSRDGEKRESVVCTLAERRG